MSSEPKGSTPGSIAPHNYLTRVNTFPNAEFTIPPSDTLSSCQSAQTHSADAYVIPSKYKIVHALHVPEKFCAAFNLYEASEDYAKYI
jgi:hypothetical protein